MAKFREYKNGIFGHRYKGYYILRNNNNQSKRDKLYTVIDENKKVIFADNPDYDDCEWLIDKLVATDTEMQAYRELYACTLARLHRMATKYSQMVEEKNITKEEKKLYELVLKIMNRKSRDLEF